MSSNVLFQVLVLPVIDPQAFGKDLCAVSEPRSKPKRTDVVHHCFLYSELQSFDFNLISIRSHRRHILYLESDNDASTLLDSTWQYLGSLLSCVVAVSMIIVHHHQIVH